MKKSVYPDSGFGLFAYLYGCSFLWGLRGAFLGALAARCGVVLIERVHLDSLELIRRKGLLLDCTPLRMALRYIVSIPSVENAFFHLKGAS